MPQYSKNKPARGRERVSLGEALPPGVPGEVEPEPTPIDGLLTPEGHVDRDVALQTLIKQNHELRHTLFAVKKASDDEAAQTLSRETSSYESGVAKVQRWGKRLGWVAGAVGVIFSVGVSWALWMGANATDAEVEKAIQEIVTEHIIPAHEDAIEFHKKIDGRVKEVEADLSHIDRTQQILDKRSEYQFELGRWQAKSLEAERKRKKPPKKPPVLEELEKELMGFGP